MIPETTPDYRYFNLLGSHRHIGYELGNADPPFQMQSWWAKPAPLPFAQACAEVVRDIHPHLMDEFVAYADAQHIASEVLWQQCCRVNLKAHIRAKELEIGEGCSTFVHYTPQGNAVVGRNYDYWSMQVRRQRLRFVPDCCALATIGGRGGVPCGRYDGMNQHGLFASLHVVMTENPDEREVKPGVPFHVVCRIALEQCHTAREARDLLLQMPHLSSLNYLLADAREAFVIEADPRRVRVLPISSQTLAATNHFRHPDMRPLQGRRSSTNSECRLGFLSGQKLGSHQHLSVSQLLDAAEKVMADRSAPVCGHSGSLTTLWSCVAELQTKRIRYAPGKPSETRYEEIERI